MEIVDYATEAASAGWAKRVLAVLVSGLLVVGVVAALTSKEKASGRPVTVGEVAILARAADGVAAVHSARMAFQLDMKIGGQQVVTSMEGAIDNDRKLGEFTTTFKRRNGISPAVQHESRHLHAGR